MSGKKERIEKVTIGHEIRRYPGGIEDAWPTIESKVFCDGCPYLRIVDEGKLFTLTHGFDKLALCEKVKAYITSSPDYFMWNTVRRPIFCPNIEGDFSDEDKKFIKIEIMARREDYEDYERQELESLENRSKDV